MTCQRKPRVAVVAICGRRLKHPVEARVTHGRNCGYCLGKTKHGYPRHPLYVRADVQPSIYFDITEDNP